jgi:hypothetical protein
MDLTRRPSGRWIIDFGCEMSEQQAELYEAPYAYVLKHVRPVRLQNRREAYAAYWWEHVEPRPSMWAALHGTYSERRYKAIGAAGGVILFVAYTMRGNNICRMISARRASRRERAAYSLQAGARSQT